VDFKVEDILQGNGNVLVQQYPKSHTAEYDPPSGISE